MAFPTTLIVDEFDDTENPMTGWSTPSFMSNISSNGSTAGGTSTNNMAVWNTAITGDQECFAEIITKGSTGHVAGVAVMAKQTGSVLTLDSYQFSVTIAGGTDAWALDRVTNGASASTIASGSQEISAGNIIGVRVHNGTVEGWYYNGSVWSLMGSGSDSTYTGTGNAYILLVGTTFRLGYAGCGNVRGAGLINNTAVMASRVGGGLIG